MPVSLRKMETWHRKGQQGGIVMLHFFFVTLGCHFHINVRKYDVCFLHLKLPISCWSKDRAHPYLGYAVLVNDRNLHCHINNTAPPPAPPACPMRRGGCGRSLSTSQGSWSFSNCAEGCMAASWLDPQLRYTSLLAMGCVPGGFRKANPTQ